MIGPPGTGKSRLAGRLATILPEMTLAEAIETTRIHRVAGLTGRHTAFVTTRPCRTPRHAISAVGWIGSGQIPAPGEVLLADGAIRAGEERRQSPDRHVRIHRPRGTPVVLS
jgi:magnesium chelatase family protein